MTEHPAWRKRACPHCAAGMSLSSDPAYHWTGNWNLPKCQAPTAEEYIAQLEAERDNLKSAYERAYEHGFKAGQTQIIPCYCCRDHGCLDGCQCKKDETDEQPTHPTYPTQPTKLLRDESTPDRKAIWRFVEDATTTQSRLDRLDRIRLDWCEHMASQYPDLEKAGLVPMRRAAIDKAMSEENAASLFGGAK